MRAWLLRWSDARGDEERPFKSVVTVRCSRLAEFAEHSVDRVESRIDLLSDLKRDEW